MSGALGRPDDGARIAALERRVAMLERRTTPGGHNEFEVTFSYTGALVAGTESPWKPVRRGGLFAVFAVALKDVGSTDTVLSIRSGATILNYVTIPAGVREYRTDIMRRFTPEQLLSLRVDTAGAGAGNMTATARFA